MVYMRVKGGHGVHASEGCTFTHMHGRRKQIFSGGALKKHSHPIKSKYSNLDCTATIRPGSIVIIIMLTTFTSNMLIACKSGGAFAPWPTPFLRP